MRSIGYKQTHQNWQQQTTTPPNKKKKKRKKKKNKIQKWKTTIK
jgi:hypothetical protein